MADDVISWTSIEGLEKAMGKEPAAVMARKLLGFLEGKVAETEQAFAGGDNETLLNCLHKLASNAAALGALKLCHAARALEAECHAGAWDKVRAQGGDITALSQQSVRILKERLG